MLPIVRAFILCLTIPALGGCAQSNPTGPKPGREAATPAAVTESAPANREALPPDTGPPPHIDATKAMDYTRQVVRFGPRYLTSPGHKKTEEFLRAHLKNDNLEEDAFTATTPAGTLPMVNFIAKFPGSQNGVVVLAGHYDTLYGRKDFVGANDAASDTGLLLAIADYLRAQKNRPGYGIWLVWLDGEEAIKQWSDADSVYGAKHLAEKWQKDGTAKNVKAFLLADMIGDKDLDIDRDQNSTPWLEDIVGEAATRLGYQSHFFQRLNAVEDDHLPFARIGVPVADLIDFSYGYNNVFWHSPQDTVDKLSPQSLQIVGDVMLQTARLLPAHK
ncbi:MAG TPA: M28 family peptidase [Terriglobales bacterium]|nr:M28 family peptidase [Terriglobales bacterium]